VLSCVTISPLIRQQRNTLPFRANHSLRAVVVNPTITLEQPLWIAISHPDEVVAVTRGYGPASRAEDFSSSLTTSVRDDLNKITALTVLV
jgi:hypothetical protein